MYSWLVKTVCDDLVRAQKTGEGEPDVIRALSQAIDELESQLKVIKTMREMAMSRDVPPEVLVSVKNSYENGRLDN